MGIPVYVACVSWSNVAWKNSPACCFPEISPPTCPDRTRATHHTHHTPGMSAVVGRPRRARTRAGTLKGSSWLESQSAHAAGLHYSIRLDLPAAARPHALTFARRRFPRMSRAHLSAPAERPSSEISLHKWLRAVLVYNKDPHLKDERGLFSGYLPVPCSMVGLGRRATRAIEGEWMLLQWVDMWKRGRTKLTYNRTLGFGLQAVRPINRGVHVLSGVVESDADTDHAALIEPHGTLYGPLSLVNAACANCANIEMFRPPNGQLWVGRVRQSIRVGDMLCAQYPVTGCAVCAVCKGNL
jgi:hypothetical protein